METKSFRFPVSVMSVTAKRVLYDPVLASTQASKDRAKSMENTHQGEGVSVKRAGLRSAYMKVAKELTILSRPRQ